MKAIPLIESWCKAIRTAVESELLSGKPVEGFKLVRGRQGNRSWTSKDEAEELLKSMRLKQEEMYSFELISPTTAEKLLKDTPRRWSKVEALITRKEGPIGVAPENDKRPAFVIAQAGEGFDVVGDTENGD